VWVRGPERKGPLTNNHLTALQRAVDENPRAFGEFVRRRAKVDAILQFVCIGSRH
jgi:hypothetical protein